MSTDDSDEIELDFTHLDRVKQYMDGDDGSEETDQVTDLPEWLQTTDPIEDLYSRESLIKAVTLVRNEKVTDAGRPGLYDVSGSDTYTCNVIELEHGTPGVTCTCPNGSNRSGRPTCYHSAAALLVHTEVDIEAFIEKAGL